MVLCNSCVKDDGEALPTCDQACQDNLTSAGVIDLWGFLYNQNFAGQPVGAQNLEVDCALGGSVHITGSNGYDPTTEVVALNLSYDMASCAASDSTYNLTLDGVVSQSGTTEHQGQISIVYGSAAITFDGTVGDEPATEDNCSLALQEQRDSDNSNYRVSGTLCARPVSY
ncbi:MAG: hypothetical protein DRI90_09975 [Deltaproteobacteria bacterium]|nr:MAG: hypothetical protein DRI90_09975 [Deltaproteobacteria bacterium]